MDRKEFFENSFHYFFKKASSAIVKTQTFDYVDECVRSLENSYKKKELPPGAIDDFYNRCTGCDICMAACPINIIMIEDLEKRYPIIYPDEGPCIHCQDYPCITSCPTGALSEIKV